MQLLCLSTLQTVLYGGDMLRMFQHHHHVDFANDQLLYLYICCAPGEQQATSAALRVIEVDKTACSNITESLIRLMFVGLMYQV